MKTLIIIFLFTTCNIILTAQTTNTWSFVGPINNPTILGGTSSSTNGSGRICDIAFHPTNSNLLYLSSPRGSVYLRNESTNSSNLINPDFPYSFTRSGVATIAIDPKDANNILIGTGDNQGPIKEWESRMSSTGIYLSTDGGSSFIPTSLSKEEGDTRFDVNKDNYMRVSKIMFDPNNEDVAYAIVRWCIGGDETWATTGGEIYRSENGGVDWEVFTMDGLTSVDKYFWDMEIENGGSLGHTILYVSSRKLYKYTEEYDLWEDKTSTLLSSQNDLNANFGRILLTVAPEGASSTYDHYIAALLLNQNTTYPSNYLDLYISQDGFETNVTKESGTAIDNENYASIYRLSFAVNANFSRFYFGSVKFRYTTDGGTTVTSITIHDDIMNIKFPPYTGSNLNTVFVGCDGGFYKSTDGSTFTQSNNGLGGVAQIFNLDYATNYYRLIAGTQDCASFRFDDNGWKALLQGGDGSTCLFHPEDEDIFYTSDYQNDCDDINPCYGDVFYNTSGGSSYDNMDDDEGEERRSEISTVVMANDYSDPGSIFIGWEDLRKSNPGTLDFTHISDPPLHTSQTTNAIRAIAVSKSDPSIIYIACEGVWVDDSGNQSSDYTQENVEDKKDYELFVHHNYGIDDMTASHGWVNISPKINGVRSSITSIAISDVDPDKIWITYSAYIKNGDPPTDNCNVYKGVVGSGPSYTTTWTAYSEHLPKIPTNKIIYQDGTNDRLFVCTDIGDETYESSVYYRDASMSQWEIVAEGIAHSMVLDIAIDYCRQKIGAATFGGGIWEAPLPYSSTEDITINSDAIWATDRYIYSNIVIEADATLTITSGAVINMGGGRKITVKRGARLVIDDATITNQCGALWEGIEVWGYDDLDHPVLTDVLSGAYPASEDDHGVVFITGNSVIENSHNGISTSKYNEAGSSDPDYHGGIIIALASTFRNNRRSAEFLIFGRENVSEFIGCTFVTDDILYENAIPYAHVSMWAVKGVLFMDNTFENTISPAPMKGIKRGRGIYSEEATYDVLRGCIEPIEPCGCELWNGNTFQGLYRGIEARSIGVDFIYPLTIDGNIFIDNERAILISSIGNIEMINNDIQVPDFEGTICYGLYLEGSINYHVENNSFTTSGSVTEDADPNSGMFVANNSSTGTMVYRNHFTDMEIGMRCQNTNSGLQIRCNDFSSLINKYNIIVTSGSLAHQGSCFLHPASNIFSHDCPAGISHGDFRLQSGVSGFNYYYKTGEDPTCYSSGINLILCSGTWDCEPQLEDPCDEEEESFMMMQSGEDIQELIEADYAKIDGGNTLELLEEIEQGSVTKEQLDEIGPYLSDIVLVALIETPTELSTSDILNVLSDNSPLTANVSESLEAAAITNEFVIMELTETSLMTEEGTEIIYSPMQLLMAEIDYLENERSIVMQNRVNAYLAENDIESAITVLSIESDDWANQKLVSLYFSLEDYEAATTSLNNLNLSDPSISEFKDLMAMLIDIKSEGRNYSEMSTEEEATLRNLNSKESSTGIAAGNILRFAFSDDYPEVIDSIFEEIELRTETLTNQTSDPTFKLYPNPASKIVYIDLINVATPCDVLLTIYDVTGRIVNTQVLGAEHTTSWVELLDLKSGIYFFELKCNNISIGVERLIIE